MISAFEIRINGKPFTLWEGATVNTGIDKVAGAFSFLSTNPDPENFPVRKGDSVQITVNGVPKITGFVDTIDIQKDVNAHSITIAGRDNTADLIDSSIPDAGKTTQGPISLKALCEKVIGALGANIPVVDKTTGVADLTANDFAQVSGGQSAIDFLLGFARKRRVYLVPSGTGALVLYQPDDSNKAATPIVHERGNDRNNVEAMTFTTTDEARFNKYVARSQDNMTADDGEYEDAGTDRSASVTDSAIRPSRYLEIQAEESMTAEEIDIRVQEAANLRRTQGTIYSPVVTGVAQQDGTLWDFGQFVRVRDMFAPASGVFFLKAVTYELSVNAGTTTTLELVSPDAYQGVAARTTGAKRKANAGDQYESVRPELNLPASMIIGRGGRAL